MTPTVPRDPGNVLHALVLFLLLRGRVFTVTIRLKLALELPEYKRAFIHGNRTIRSFQEWSGR